MSSIEHSNESSFAHTAVLVEQVLALADRATAPIRCIVDGTVGGGQHSALLLERFPEAKLWALDRDPAALRTAHARLAPFGARAVVIESEFGHVAEVMSQHGIMHQADIMLVDLGVSSHQLDTADRGFSFRQDGPLDMRMDPTHGKPAVELLADVDAQQLSWVLATWGEERYARRIARSILSCQPQTTAELAEAVYRVVGRRRVGIDPATRTFQAIRMWVNDEMKQLDQWLAAVPDALSVGGVAMAISFHSLEDRAVKKAFKEAAQGCICPPRIPICGCGRQPLVRILTPKPWSASDVEVEQNTRARSAKIRAVQRLERI